MAIIPANSFPTQTQPPTSAYPYGSAQNITTTGDNTGTPWNKTVVDDLWGFLQALLDAGAITPSGSPDAVGASDYLDALNAIFSGGGGPSNYIVASNNSTAISYGSADNFKYQRLTNASPIVVTMLAPTGSFGDTITLDKVAGSGDITINGDAGITVETISGGSNLLTTDGQVASLVSLDATTWKLIV